MEFIKREPDDLELKSECEDDSNTFTHPSTSAIEFREHKLFDNYGFSKRSFKTKTDWVEIKVPAVANVKSEFECYNGSSTYSQSSSDIEHTDHKLLVKDIAADICNRNLKKKTEWLEINVPAVDNLNFYENATQNQSEQDKDRTNDQLLNNEKCERTLEKKEMIKSQNQDLHCKICNKAFTYHSRLRAHMNIHTETKNFKCDLCNKAFANKSYLRRHMNIHVGTKYYKCDLCNKAFTQKSTLVNHITSHIGKKIFKCDLCKKAFTNKNYLRNHKAIHTGTTKYKCDICYKEFKYKNNLERHNLGIHLGLKKYICDLCNKEFSQKSSLLRHLDVHIALEKYNCESCKEGYRAKSAFDFHMKTHTCLKKIICELCNKAFTPKRSLGDNTNTQIAFNKFRCDKCNEAHLSRFRYSYQRKPHAGIKIQS